MFTDMVNSRCFILMKNRVRPDSQLFNSCGSNSWAKGMGCPPSQLTRGLGKCRKILHLGPWWSPGQKTSFGVHLFTAWKRDLISLPLPFPITSPDFSLTNSATFPGFPGEWSPCIVHHEVKNQNISKRTSSNVTRAYLNTTLRAECEKKYLA